MSNQSLNFNLEFPSRIITVRDNAINWVWYHQYEISKGFEPGVLWARLVASDRLHKFDERQGGEAHPKTETPNLFESEHFYHRPNYRTIKAFGMSVIKEWEKACNELGVRDDDTKTILKVRKGDLRLTFPIRGWE